MKKHPLFHALMASALSASILTTTARAHTEAAGYEVVGPGSINVWFGTYHGLAESPTFEGQALLTTPSASTLSMPFSMATDVRPAGLIDGVNTQYVSGYDATSITTWQGVNFSGLTTNGHYTVGYDPAFPQGSSKWSNDFDGDIGFDVVGIIAIIPATPTAAAPAITTFFVVNKGAIFSLLQSALPLAEVHREVVLNLTRTTTRDVNARLFRLRADLSSGEDGAAGFVGPKGRLGSTMVSDGKTLRPAKESKNVVSDEFHRWEVFAAGDFGAFDVEDTSDSHGFGENVWVGTIGAEYRLNRSLAFGIAGSYVESDSEISRGVGAIDSEGAAISAYGSAVWKSCYFDLFYSFANLEGDIRRHTLTGQTARGDSESKTHTVSFNTGYTIKSGNLHTGPLAGLDWVHGDVQGYRENGGGSAAVVFPDQNFDSLISKLGWQVSYTIPTRAGKITPQVRASWDHEFLDSSETISASLQQSPFATITGTSVTTGGKFSASTKTTKPGSDYLNLGAGISAQLGDRVTATLDYATHIFQARESAHFGSVRVGVSF